MADATLRAALIDCARRLRSEGLVVGTSGNVSARADRGGCLITPSGVDYQGMIPEDLVTVDQRGARVSGRLKPSTDTLNHLAIYRSRAEVNAIVHTHSPYATVFAVLRRPIAPLLAEAAGFLGGPVRVMDYLPPAAPQLAERVATGLGSDTAVLLPNHGVIAVGESIGQALTASVLVEQSARIAFLASLLGEPVPLPEGEVDRMRRFLHEGYGQS